MGTNESQFGIERFRQPKARTSWTMSRLLRALDMVAKPTVRLSAPVMCNVVVDICLFPFVPDVVGIHVLVAKLRLNRGDMCRVPGRSML